MQYLFVLSCLLAVCLTVSYGQARSSSATGRSTGVPATTGRPGTTNRPISTTSGNTLTCVCSCCSGLRCKPVALQSFADATCTTKACKEKCKIFEPKHCDHTFMGTNDAFCTVKL
ncbi:hypothetical protein I4U23_019751 [Adineta vaga]|nr:hypothetical protein I4U23_019751 [Adineta vaga]